MKIIYHLAKAFQHIGLALLRLADRMLGFVANHKKEDSSDE